MFDHSLLHEKMKEFRAVNIYHTKTGLPNRTYYIKNRTSEPNLFLPEKPKPEPNRFLFFLITRTENRTLFSKVRKPDKNHLKVTQVFLSTYKSSDIREVWRIYLRYAKKNILKQSYVVFKKLRHKARHTSVIIFLHFQFSHAQI